MMLSAFWNPKSCRICQWFVRSTQRKAGVGGMSSRAIEMDAKLLEAACRHHGVVTLWRAWLRK